MTDKKRRVKVFMEKAGHKPHLLVLSKFPNYQYTVSAIVSMAAANDLIWSDEGGGLMEVVSPDEALKCIDVYQKWWHDLEDKFMEGIL
jgi:hypothetical protein